MSRSLITSAVLLACLAAPAFAQQQTQQQETNQPTVVAPAPSPGPATTPPTDTIPVAPAASNPPGDANPQAPVATAPQSVKCTLIEISVPGLEQGKPGTYDATVKDKKDGLVDALHDCNKAAAVAGFVPNSTKSARIKVTQGLDGHAYFKVPTDRLASVLVSVHIGKSDWQGPRYFTSAGPVADRTEIALVAGDEKDAGQLYKE